VGNGVGDTVAVGDGLNDGDGLGDGDGLADGDRLGVVLGLTLGDESRDVLEAVADPVG
jgi:hypothetical protein